MARLALVDTDQNILTSVAMTLEVEVFKIKTLNFFQSALSEIDKSVSNMAVLDIKMARMGMMAMLQGLLQKLACQFNL